MFGLIFLELETDNMSLVLKKLNLMVLNQLHWPLHTTLLGASFPFLLFSVSKKT